MRHYQFVILDSAIRGAWFNQGKFPLSSALHASARMKGNRDSSGKVNAQRKMF